MNNDTANLTPAPAFPIERVRPFGDGIDHSEGVAVSPDGSVYAGGELGQIYRISEDGQRTQLIACTGGFILGLTLDRKGNLFACDMKHRALFRIDPAGRIERAADRCGPAEFRLPNFTVFDADGNLYLTDSGHFKQQDGLIYRIRASSGQIEVFDAGPFAFPNGLAFNAAEDALLVIESNRDRVLRIQIKRDGSAGERSIYCQGLAHVPDGMAFDAAGNLYVACYGLNRIYRVEASGGRRVTLYCEDLENHRLMTPTNLAFGGSSGLDKLFVGCLGARHLAVLDPVGPGLPLYSHSHLKEGS